MRVMSWMKSDSGEGLCNGKILFRLLLLVPLILALTVTGGVVAPATASARQGAPGATSGTSAAGSTQAQCGRLVRERVGAWLCMATPIVQAQAARVADIGLGEGVLQNLGLLVCEFAWRHTRALLEAPSRFCAWPEQRANARSARVIPAGRTGRVDSSFDAVCRDEQHDP